MQISIGKVAWKDLDLTFHDAKVEPDATVRLADAGIELTELMIDLDQNAPPPPPVELRAWLTAPDLIDRATMTGSLVLGSRATSATLSAWGSRPSE